MSRPSLRSAAVLLALSLLVGAGCSTGPNIPNTLQVEPDPAPALPAGLRLGEGTLFSVDRSTEVLRVPLAGSAGHRVDGLLTDTWGRRELRYQGPAGEPETVATQGWLLPPAGAVNTRGEVLVCFGVLPGRNTELTEGAMPDPTQGLPLLCRHRTADGWSPLLQADEGAKAAWLKRVEPMADGSFMLHYYRDAGWLVQPTATDHGACTQRFTEGRFEPALLIEPVDPALLP